MRELTMKCSIWIDAPRESVWRAVTETPRIKEWWCDDSYGRIPALQVGATVAYGKEDDPFVATIVVVDPPREFAFQWPPHPRWFSIEMTTRYRLDEENGGTRVLVSESGFEKMPEHVRQDRCDRITREYQMVLENLKAHLEGRSLPFRR